MGENRRSILEIAPAHGNHPPSFSLFMYHPQKKSTLQETIKYPTKRELRKIIDSTVSTFWGDMLHVSSLEGFFQPQGHRWTDRYEPRNLEFFARGLHNLILLPSGWLKKNRRFRPRKKRKVLKMVGLGKHVVIFLLCMIMFCCCFVVASFREAQSKWVKSKKNEIKNWTTHGFPFISQS